MLRIDVERLRSHLEARLGVRLVSATQKIDAGIFPVIRPFDLEDNHAFSIALGRTPREVSASFHLDGYAGRLLRVMYDSDEATKGTFNALLASGRASGLRVLVEIDGEAVKALPHSGRQWSGLAMEVYGRLPSGVNEEGLHDAIVEAAGYCLGLALSLVPLEEIAPAESEYFGASEGGVTRVEVNKYERSPVNRAACIAFHGPTCKGCAFDFSDMYGPIGEGYIEVHHLVPVSQMGSEYAIDPVNDLVPLCANCHAVVHRRNPPLSIDELRSIVQSQRARRSDVTLPKTKSH